MDAGQGWLIFALPAAEVALHPAEDEDGDRHELYLMCDDVKQVVAGWGVVTRLTLPGGGQLGLDEPRHPVATGLTPGGGQVR